MNHRDMTNKSIKDNLLMGVKFGNELYMRNKMLYISKTGLLWGSVI